MTQLAAALLAEPDEIRRQAQAAAERSAISQGLPPRIVDRAALQQVAALLRGQTPAANTSSPSTDASDR